MIHLSSIVPLEREFPFFHVFQPVMDLRNDSIYGFEVLLRSPDGKNPELIFMEAQEEGRLFELDIDSIFKACEAGLNTFKDGYLMINVYPSTMIHPDFLPLMDQLTQQLNIQPEKIILEINESEKKSQFYMLQTIVRQLRRTGYRIALDDIGKGDATLQSIIEFEPEVVKLDRYFMRDLAVSHKKRRYLKKIVEVFGEDIQFVLEGLETDEDLHITKTLDIPLGQGFYLGRPQPSSYYHGLMD
jgi:EAL domain-containing protein (putative c-di-GMP-specific phosphodiesterase class I)